MSNINLPPDYVYQLKSCLDNMRETLLSAYVPLLKEIASSNQLTESLVAVSENYAQSIISAMDVADFTTPLLNISDNLRDSISKIFANYDFSSINQKLLDSYTPVLNKLVEQYSKIDYEHIFNELIVDDEYVEVDDISFNTISDVIDTLHTDEDCKFIEKPDSNRMTKLNFFLAVIYPLILMFIPMGVDAYKDHVNAIQSQQIRLEHESFRDELLEQFKQLNDSVSVTAEESRQVSQCPYCEVHTPSEDFQDTHSEVVDDSTVQESETQPD